MKKKDYNYFSELEKLSHYSYESAVFLRKALRGFDPGAIEGQVQKLHELKHSVDKRKQDMMNRLAKEFITPIEREDIIELAHTIDNVTDGVENILMKIDMYYVKSMKADALEFCEVVERCCAAVKESMKEFHHFHKSAVLGETLIQIQKLEEDADALHARSVKRLFRMSKDPIELMVWTDIFDCFEGCCDACERVGDVIQSVVMKNS